MPPRVLCFSELPWSLWIWTSEMKGAGTDAQVFLQVYGETGKSDQMKLESKSDSFEQGQCDKFIVCLCVFLSLCLIKMYSGPKTYLYT